MKGLRKKLKDRSGASILLALLFFLLCSMVGASVLMAAVSNAGKSRSNREEQRKYLLLSSALRLVCDELASAQYEGEYTSEQVEVWKKDEHGNDIEDEDGNKELAYSYMRYTQVPGTFTCGLNDGLNDVLPLLPELDAAFAGTFPTDGRGESQDDDIYIPLSGSDISGQKHTLTLSVNASGVEGLDEGKVSVTLWMDSNYSIRLTATQGEEDADEYVYTMEACLDPSGTTPDMGASSHPVGPRKWTLGWIAKREAGG